jgi:quercetin dioxygenase-like cupin family protein
MAKSKIMIDNKVTRVTKWSFLPGEDTGQHIHEYDYVVVPMTDGNLKIIDNYGNETISKLSEGISYFREKGINHNVININNFSYSFIEIEFK